MYLLGCHLPTRSATLTWQFPPTANTLTQASSIPPPIVNGQRKNSKPIILSDQPLGLRLRDAGLAGAGA